MDIKISWFYHMFSYSFAATNKQKTIESLMLNIKYLYYKKSNTFLLVLMKIRIIFGNTVSFIGVCPLRFSNKNQYVCILVFFIGIVFVE